MTTYGGLLSAILAAGALALGSPASAATLRAGGSGSVTELLRELAPAFKAETGTDLEVVPSLGSDGANAALADGLLGIAMASRDLTAAEAARGVKVAATFRTPYGLATSRPGPDHLKSADIAQLYRADRPLWPDGTPILIVLRPANQSDTFVLGGLFPGMADALQSLRKREDLSVAFTDQANAELGESTKGSLIGATVAQVTTEKRNLRFVSIDGVAPSLETLENGSYPYGKILYVVVPTVVGPEAASFLAFLARPATGALLRKAGVDGGAR
jgi:phosphate transport system substrate-binding protein